MLTQEGHPDSVADLPRARDTAFMMCLSRVLASGGSAGDFQRIGGEIRRIRASRGYPPTARYGTLRKIAWVATMLWVPVSFVFASVVLGNSGPIGPGWWIVVLMTMVPPGLLCGLIVAILWLVVLSHRGTARVGSKVRINPNCVVCHYDLRGTIPMVHPSKLRGTWIGPERCPECGLVWPLIPKELGGQENGSGPIAREEGRA